MSQEDTAMLVREYPELANETTDRISHVLEDVSSDTIMFE